MKTPSPDEGLLPPLCIPHSFTDPVELLPPHARPSGSATAAMVRRVLARPLAGTGEDTRRRLVGSIARCVRQLRYGSARSGSADVVAVWETDLVLEACELAIRTLREARGRMLANAMLAWVDGEAEGQEGAPGGARAIAMPPPGTTMGASGMGGGDEDNDAEQIVAQLMGLCEIRGWLVAKREH